jgi:cytochrome b561
MRDNPQAYGTLSRFFHWFMALLLLWQLASVVARVLLKDSSIDKFLWATHKPLGALLLLLVAVRIIWTLINLSRRPASINFLAKLGHLTLYLLLFAVPALGLARQYGSGRAFDVFGIPLFSGFEGKIEWLMTPGNLLHGNLGWILFALIVGHILMVIVHRKAKGHVDVLPRMWGKK